MDLTKYFNIFTEESKTYLQELEQLLIQAEKRPDEQHLWEEVHGRLHSLKGMARTLDLNHISTFCHSMETWCLELQQGRRTVTPLLMETLFNGVDLLKELVIHHTPDQSLPEQQRYNRLLARFQAAQPAPPAQPTRTGFATPAPETMGMPQKLDYVRVRYSLIEELLGLAQEILLKDRDLPPLTDDHMTAALQSWLDDYGSSLKDLMHRLTQLRLMSIHHFAGLFSRNLRDLARKYGKQVELNVQGGVLEADISLLERLREPVNHIISNCLAHGIEPPDQRLKIGKPATGQILLSAQRKRDHLRIRITDDGRGIDREAVATFLKEQRGLAPAEIDQLANSAFYGTILDPGFSSAVRVSRLAGRGIGMHVVHEALTFLGGSLTIESQPNAGTQYTLLLPLSLSSIDAIVFQLGDFVLAVPSNRIRAIDHQELEHPGPFVPAAGLNYHDLGKTFKITQRRRKTYHLLHLHAPPDNPGSKSENGICVAVDKVIAIRTLMVLPPGDLMAGAGIYSGIGVLPDGRLAPIVEPEVWLQDSGPLRPTSQKG